MLDVAAVTSGQPFCAGAVLMHEGRLVATVNEDHVPSNLPPGTLRLGSVGGGQEPAETIWECAVREAVEETSVHVELVSSPVTFARDDVESDFRRIECVDDIAPLIFERTERANPDVAYEPGLPTGPYLYGAVFLASPAVGGTLEPGDVEALLLVPPELVEALDGATVGAAIGAGAALLERDPIEHNSLLWLHPHETLRLLPRLLREAGLAEW